MHEFRVNVGTLSGLPAAAARDGDGGLCAASFLAEIPCVRSGEREGGDQPDNRPAIVPADNDDTDHDEAEEDYDEHSTSK